MYANALFDAEALGHSTQAKRHDVEFTLAGHRVRCVYIRSKGTVRYEIDRWRVPVDSVQQLLNRYRSRP